MMQTEPGEDEVTCIIRYLAHPEWNVRDITVRRIRGISDPLILADLLEYLALEKWFIREAAASGIRSLSDDRLIPCLLDTITKGDNILKNAAVCALGNMKSVEAKRVLEMVAEDPDRLVRRNARRALERIRQSCH